MADHRHKRDTDARRPFRMTAVAAPLAVVATASAVTWGIVDSDPASTAQITSADAPVRADAAAAAADAVGTDVRATASRSGARRDSAEPLSQVDRLLRPKAKRRAIAQAKPQQWTTENLNLWTEPGKRARKTGEIEAGSVVRPTGRELYGRQEVVWGKKQTRWVSVGYLSKEKPFALGGDCTNGTSVPSGVSPNVAKVHAAVCAAFPEITTYGTFRSDGEHSQGLAVDIMVSGDRGWEVAEFVRKYYAELGVSYVIYAQNIWSVERSGEGWRGMSNRGSSTANHFDHVHVTTF
ncbi:mucin-2 protein [Nocardioides sp. R-C-SC26]|uniref:mucin-2 protein n=1 Tax=Nocardioides sp. R-C-SC26 TaxID=2870414 RepID=UPI001E3E64D2|nr:mucin-2 protein [Nocardioides sp. R-C-SC26]